jgi:hypothetical protein
MTEPYDPASTEEFPQHKQRRRWPKWFFLLLGLALGLALGLTYTWVINPVQYYNTDPVDLRAQHKERWILLVAVAYRQDGDLDRAFSRLAGLQDTHIGQTVADLAEREIQAGKPASRIRALAALADALGARTDAMMIYLATPEPTLFFTPTPVSPSPLPSPVSTATGTPAPTASVTPTATSTPTATPTPWPTITQRPTATVAPPYYLERRQRICESDRETPRIEIVVQTEEGAGIPGREIWVTWTGGVDRFYTGLKPELGLGYADFDMAPGAEYAVAVGDPTLQIINRLRPEPCRTGAGDSILASWRLTIVATGDASTPTPTATSTPIAPATRTARPTLTSTTTPTSSPTRTRMLP